jgi:hypothetical protein
MVTGFVMVSRNVEPYEPASPSFVSFCVFSFGFARIVRVPRKRRNAPPTMRSHTCCWTRKSEMKAKPKAAMQPYTASAVAAPKPEIKPWSRPSARVRRMHRTPMGPTGAAMLKPMMAPLRRVSALTTISIPSVVWVGLVFIFVPELRALCVLMAKTQYYKGKYKVKVVTESVGYVTVEALEDFEDIVDGETVTVKKGETRIVPDVDVCRQKGLAPMVKEHAYELKMEKKVKRMVAEAEKKDGKK